jgi:hypothetical protein
MKALFYATIMLFSINAHSWDLSNYGVVTTGFEAPKYRTVEELKIFKEISDETRPHILPAITGTIGMVGAAVTGAIAGVPTLVLITSVVLNGVVYYIYGYGAERIITEMVITGYLSPENVARVKSSAKESEARLKQGYANTQEFFSNLTK